MGSVVTFDILFPDVQLGETQHIHVSSVFIHFPGNSDVITSACTQLIKLTKKNKSHACHT